MSTIDVKMEKLLDQMQGGREDQIAEIVSMKKLLKSAMLKQNLKEHPALTQLLNLLRKREQAYTLILSNKEDLDPIKRQGMFDRRGECRFILSFFEVDKTIQGIEKQLDYQLSDEVEE